ncbi:hypothetical protein [Paraburkholderia sp. GAS334]|uniref:hypothetical protein n=1 Tax=unclassified Paraburkholderia TaxID=2615204 RepID=UPI003D24B5E8
MPATTGARFGRLALCAASASALALGVVGTIAYVVWFNHDQRIYAEAVMNARQALRFTGLKPPAQQIASSGQIVLSPSPAASAVPVASVSLAASASSDAPDQLVANSTGAAAPRPAARPAPAPALAHRSGNKQAASNRPPNSLLTRMGSFFHRASYRQHGTGNQRDLYSHP